MLALLPCFSPVPWPGAQLGLCLSTSKIRSGCDFCWLQLSAVQNGKHRPFPLCSAVRKTEQVLFFFFLPWMLSEQPFGNSSWARNVALQSTSYVQVYFPT